MTTNLNAAEVMSEVMSLAGLLVLEAEAETASAIMSEDPIDAENAKARVEAILSTLRGIIEPLERARTRLADKYIADLVDLVQRQATRSKWALQ